MKETNIIDEYLKKGKVATYKTIDDLKKDYPVLSTGIPEVDMAFGNIDPTEGNGGIVAGRALEVSGFNQSGKSILADQMMSATLKRFPGRSVLALFSEPTDAKRLESVGIDLDRLIALESCLPELCDGRTVAAEDAFETIINLLPAKELKLVLIDSVAALTVRDQLERKMSENEAVAKLAGPMNRFMKSFLDFNVNHTTFLSINHYRTPITTMGIMPSRLRKDTTGGRTKDFFAWDRVYASATPLWTKEHPVLNKKVQWGLDICYEVFKNKSCKSVGDRTVTIEFDLKNSRFNHEKALINYAGFFGHKENDKIISKLSVPILKAGAWVYIGKERFQGSDSAEEYLRKNKDLTEKLWRELVIHGDEFFEGGLLKASEQLDDYST